MDPWLTLEMTKPHLLRRLARFAVRDFTFENVDQMLHVLFGLISPANSLLNFSLTPSSVAHLSR